MVFNSPCLTDKKELIHHEVEMVINSPWIMPLLGTKGLASPEQTAIVGLSVAGSRFPEGFQCCWILMFKFKQGSQMQKTILDSKNEECCFSRDIQLICAEEFSSIQVKTQADWMLLQSSHISTIL
ncbi:hypothetical protein Tco_1384629 [Tanacetum coccineum]